jgi:hypothetical protein
LIEPLARSEAGRWWLINVAPKLDRVIFPLTGGRFTSIPGHILFITHTGARSGQKRQNPLTYFTDGEDRERLWGLAKQHSRVYADYEDRAAGREIQVVRLVPIDGAGP